MNATAETAKTKGKQTHVTAAEQDLLAQIAQEIGGLSAEDAINAVPTLLDGADENYFRLGGVLHAISVNKFYEKDGFDNFRIFVETKFGLQYRKAMYWIQIYDRLVESGVPWNKVKDVGWTKLKDLAAVLTVDNVDEWVNRAMSSTTLQLQEAIKKAQAGSLATSGIQPVDDKEPEKSKVTTFTVKVHEDQKTIIKEAVEKARAEAKTDFDGVALEAICMAYMSGGVSTGGQPASLKDTLTKYSPEDILTVMEEVFPQFEITAKLKGKQKAGH